MSIHSHLHMHINIFFFHKISEQVQKERLNTRARISAKIQESILASRNVKNQVDSGRIHSKNQNGILTFTHFLPCKNKWITYAAVNGHLELPLLKGR